jgi:hypothetical protein
MNGKLQHIDRVIVMNMKMLLKILNTILWKSSILFKKIVKIIINFFV